MAIVVMRRSKKKLHISIRNEHKLCFCIKCDTCLVQGFTLVEMLVTIAIFSILMVSISGILVSSIEAQSRALSNQKLLSQSSRALEYMGRALRMAGKDTAGNCIVPNTNYDPTDSTSETITFLAYDSTPPSPGYKCRQFLLEGNQIKEKKSTDGTFGNLGNAVEITPSEIKINSLKFKVIGGSEPPTDNLQPKITILIDAEKVTEKVSKPKIRVQTTISQRHLDLQE